MERLERGESLCWASAKVGGGHGSSLRDSVEVTVSIACILSSHKGGKSGAMDLGGSY